MEVIHGEVRGPLVPEKEKAPAVPSPRRQVEHERGEGIPQLTRELKVLLKLLVRKGLITQQEYLDELKES
jgi:hypothetical protein